MHPLLGLIQLLAIGFLVALLALIIYTAWMLIHPHRRTYAWALARGQAGDPGELDEPMRFETLEIQGERGPIPVWDIEGRDPNGPLLLMTHGWGSSRQGALKRISALADHASRIIAWDLPGHGEAARRARLGSDEHLDALRIIESIGPIEHGIVLFGWSMGAGVSLALCAQIQDTHDIRGVICESIYAEPITPARAVLSLRGMPHRLSLKPAMMILGVRLGLGTRWRGFDRVEIAKKVSVPILLVHGDRDPVSPLRDARAISQSGKDTSLCVIEDGGHNNLWVDEVHRAECSERVAEFIRRCCSR